MNLLFWNIYNKYLDEIILEIVGENSVDLILLCEHQSDQSHLLKELNKYSSFFQLFPRIDHKNGLSVYYNNNIEKIEVIQDGQRFSILSLYKNSNLDTIICLVHIQSKLNSTSRYQAVDCRIVAKEIWSLEKKLNPKSVIVIGDFNMNPFEEGMINIDCFNSVYSKEDAMKNIREHRNIPYPIYYNPMINYFNEFYMNNHGTYWYDTNNESSICWNVFDQVLLRGDLIERFQISDIRMVKEVEGKKLCYENEKPNKDVYSDHLPILYNVR